MDEIGAIETIDEGVAEAPSPVFMPRIAPADEHKRLRVLLIDDEDIVHWGFRAVLADEEWVERFEHAHSGEAGIEIAEKIGPQVAIIDLLLGGESGADVCERLRAAAPTTRVLLMSGVEHMSAQSARSVGASGFVTKAWSARDIAGAARMVGLGMSVFTSERGATTNLLTEREREVLGMIAAGATNREIAAKLFLSPHTVKDHTSTLYKKMSARNRAEAIVRAQRLGLLA